MIKYIYMFSWLPFGKKKVKNTETEEQITERKKRKRKEREEAKAANAARTAAFSGDAAAKKKHAELEASIAKGDGATGPMLENIKAVDRGNIDEIYADAQETAERKNKNLLEETKGGRKKRRRKSRRKKKKSKRRRSKRRRTKKKRRRRK